jgi:hypothetical protein
MVKSIRIKMVGYSESMGGIRDANMENGRKETFWKN